MTTAPEFTLCEQLIVVASEAWRGNGELVATGIGPAPRHARQIHQRPQRTEVIMGGKEWYLYFKTLGRPDQ